MPGEEPKTVIFVMTEQPKPESPEGDEAEFDRVLRNLVNTPHKPHREPAPLAGGQKAEPGDR